MCHYFGPFESSLPYGFVVEGIENAEYATMTTTNDLSRHATWLIYVTFVLPVIAGRPLMKLQKLNMESCNQLRSVEGAQLQYITERKLCIPLPI